MRSKSRTVALLLTFALALPVMGQDGLQVTTASPPPANPQIDFDAFILLAIEVQPIRDARRLPIAQFIKIAEEKETVILDTRTKSAYDSVHVTGAVHLNYSDFSEDRLRRLFPNKNTRILIYCNNNFKQSAKPTLDLNQRASETTERDEDPEGLISATVVKRPKVALNVPTFITLWAYGYKNIYELADALPIDDPRLPLEGTAIKAKSQNTKQPAEQYDSPQPSG